MSPLASAAIDLVARDKATMVLSRLKRTLTSIRRRMEAVARAAKVMLLAIAGTVVGLLKLASNMEEVSTKFDAVFKGQADAARVWVTQQAALLQRSEKDLLSYMGTLQDTFVPFGFARDQAMELSKQLTLLGIDLASFNNVADAEVINLLTSALVGNHEAVRRFGVMITEVTLKQELLSQGIAKGATEQEKVMARLALLTKQTADAQGDAARTSDGFANQMRGLAADLQTVGIVMGNHLIPIAKEWITTIREALPAISAWVRGNGEMIVSTIKWAAGLSAAAIVLPKLIGLIQGTATAVIWLKKNLTLLNVQMAITRALAAGPLVLAVLIAVTAFVKLGHTVYTMVKQTAAARMALQQFSDTTVEWAQANDRASAARKKLRKAMEDGSLEGQKVALEELIAAYGPLIAATEADIGTVKNADRSVYNLKVQLEALQRQLGRVTAEYRGHKNVMDSIAESRERLRRAEDKSAVSAEGLVRQLKREAAALGLTDTEAKLALIGLRNFSEGQLASIDASVAAKEAYDKETAAFERRAAGYDKGVRLAGQFADTTARLRIEIGMLTGKLGKDALRIFDLNNAEMTKKQIAEILGLEKKLADESERKQKAEEQMRVSGRIEGLKALYTRIQSAAASGTAQNGSAAGARQIATATKEGNILTKLGFKELGDKLGNIHGVLQSIDSKGQVVYR